jgi:molybdopterin synthase sulfur carrier subunit
LTAEAAAPVTVRLPAALARLFPGATARVAVEAATVAEAIEALDARWPGMRDRLCASPQQLRRQVNVFVAGERATLGTRLEPGAEVIVLLALVGG